MFNRYIVKQKNEFDNLERKERRLNKIWDGNYE